MMTTTNGNTPAYPRDDAIHNGLTKREHFAGLAMQAIIPLDTVSTFETAAARAVEAADALLQALEAGK